jgi:tRNA pseudouridine38-40 synthase
VSQLSLDEPSSTAVSGSKVLKLTVAYDGTEFRGYAVQPEVRTIQGVLTEVLSRVLRQEVVLSCAGRTDSGVHAWGQVVSLPLAVVADFDVDITKIARAINGQLGPEVVVRDAELVDAAFDARYSAKWRSYRYTIVNRPVPDPFLARTSWWVREPLELSRLRLGADPFLGEHDFATFCRKREGVTTTRRVFDSTWHDLGDGVLRYDITATAFCWQMVRSIVGTLVDVGVGKVRPGDILGIIHARDRSAARRVGAPEGLCLWEVGY